MARGLLVATVLLRHYHWLLVLPLMHYASRFYQPMLPPLAYLAARAFGRLAHALEGAGATPPQVVRAAALGGMAFSCFQVMPTFVTTSKDVLGAALRHELANLDIEAHAATTGPRSYWYAIDRFMKMPNSMVMATTEVGMPAALSFERPIIDLAGLNETDFAKNPFSAERLFSRYHPDLIYMPHSVYPNVTAAIEASPAFKRYEVFTREELATKDFGLAIWRDSPHYRAMRAILGKKNPRVALP
jgi:hypothetical protein